jgi:hypothetical protein
MFTGLLEARMSLFELIDQKITAIESEIDVQQEETSSMKDDAILPVDLIFNRMGFVVDCIRNTEFQYAFELFMMCHFFCCHALPF